MDVPRLAGAVSHAEAGQVGFPSLGNMFRDFDAEKEALIPGVLIDVLVVRAEPPGQRDDTVGIFGPEFQNMTEVPHPAPVLRPEQRRVGVGVVGFRHLDQPFGLISRPSAQGPDCAIRTNRWKGSVCSWTEHSCGPIYGRKSIPISRR